jgi:hypothetical protein
VQGVKKRRNKNRELKKEQDEQAENDFNELVFDTAEELAGSGYVYGGSQGVEPTVKVEKKRRKAKGRKAEEGLEEVIDIDL